MKRTPATKARSLDDLAGLGVALRTAREEAAAKAAAERAREAEAKRERELFTRSVGTVVPLRKVASVPLPPTGTAGGPIGATGQVLVTGGAVSADGRLVVLRTYTDAYVFPAPDGDVETALRSPDRTRIALPATAQGEAVAVSADGRSLLTSTEGVPGAVHEVPLGSAAAVPAPAATATASGGVQRKSVTSGRAKPGRVSGPSA